MVQDRFWTKSYDSHVKDINPDEWNIALTQAIQETVDSLPNKMAVEFKGVELTYGEIDRYSNIFADFLLKQGFKKGDCIALNMVNIPQYVIATIAAFKIGCPITGVSLKNCTFDNVRKPNVISNVKNLVLENVTINGRQRSSSQ